MFWNKQGKWIGLLISISTVGSATAQTGGIKIHSIATGFSTRRISDDYLNIYSGKIRTTGFQYQFVVGSSSRQKRIALGWDKGVATGMHYNEVAISFTDAFSLNKNKALHLSAGYAIGTNPVFIKESAGSATKYSWAAVSSLSFYSFNSYSWKRNKLSIELSLPVIGFASRPVKSSIYNETTNGLLYNSYNDIFFTSWHNLKAVGLQVQYSAQINATWQLSGGYNYNYKRMQAEHDFLEKSHGVQIGISYHLKN